MKGTRLERVWIETPEAWVTVGDAPGAREAMEIAARAMIRLLGDKLSLSPHDALMLLGVAGDMRPGQSIFMPPLNVSYYLTVPKIET